MGRPQVQRAEYYLAEAARLQALAEQVPADKGGARFASVANEYRSLAARYDLSADADQADARQAVGVN